MAEFLGKIAMEIVQVFKKDYKRPKLWMFVISTFIIVLLLIPYIDSNFFYYSRMEKRISILSELMELDQYKIVNNKIYEQEYQSIVNEMHLQDKRAINSLVNKMNNFLLGITNNNEGNKTIKFITGGLWLFILTTCVPFMNTFKKKSDKFIAFVFIGIIALIAGWLCTLIPTIIHPMVNYIGVPFVQLIFIIILAVRSSNKE